MFLHLPTRSSRGESNPGNLKAACWVRLYECENSQPFNHGSHEPCRQEQSSTGRHMATTSIQCLITVSSTLMQMLALSLEPCVKKWNNMASPLLTMTSSPSRVTCLFSCSPDPFKKKLCCCGQCCEQDASCFKLNYQCFQYVRKRNENIPRITFG